MLVKDGLRQSTAALMVGRDLVACMCFSARRPNRCQGALGVRRRGHHQASARPVRPVRHTTTLFETPMRAPPREVWIRVIPACQTIILY